jgi:hypothetical protein
LPKDFSGPAEIEVVIFKLLIIYVFKNSLIFQRENSEVVGYILYYTALKSGRLIGGLASRDIEQKFPFPDRGMEQQFVLYVSFDSNFSFSKFHPPQSRS